MQSDKKWPSNNNDIVLQEQYDTGMMCYRSYVVQSDKNGLAITMTLCNKNNVTQVCATGAMWCKVIKMA